MSDITLNGNPCMRGHMKHPYSGAIVGEVQIDAEAKPVGKVTLLLLGRNYICTVVADPKVPTSTLSGEDAGDFNARLVAGAGGLDKPMLAMEWAQGAVVSQVLSAILTAGGEVQAADIEPSILGMALSQWSLTAGTVLGALSALVDFLALGRPGLVWRIRSDGKVWIGVPVPAAVAPPDYVITAPGPEAGQAVWELNESTVDVDQIIDGLTLRQVIYSWGENQLQATVTFAPGPVNALYQLFGQWMRRTGVDYFKTVSGRIDSQNDALSCQIQPDSTVYSALRKAAMRYGLPDVECSGVTGRAAAGWEGASPANPALQHFAPGSRATKIKLAVSTAPKPSARKGDSVSVDLWYLTSPVGESGAPVVIAISPVEPPVPPVPPLAIVKVTLTGTITSGSSIVEVGG